MNNKSCVNAAKRSSFSSRQTSTHVSKVNQNVFTCNREHVFGCEWNLLQGRVFGSTPNSLRETPQGVPTQALMHSRLSLLCPSWIMPCPVQFLNFRWRAPVGYGPTVLRRCLSASLLAPPLTWAGRGVGLAPDTWHAHAASMPKKLQVRKTQELGRQLLRAQPDTLRNVPASSMNPPR